MKTKMTLPKSTYSAPRLQVVGSIASVAERLIEAIDGEALAALPGHDRSVSAKAARSQRLH